MIRKIKIENLKAVLQATLELRQLNLFTGINGMGKSTAIQAMLLLRQSFRSGSLRNANLDLNGTLVSLGRKKDVVSQFGSDKLVIGIEGNQGDICAWDFVGMDNDDKLKIMLIGNFASNDFYMAQW
jgi:predicted ATPase